MSSSYSVELKKVENEINTLENIQQLLCNSARQVESIKNNLSRTTYAEIIDVLEWISNNENYAGNVKNLKKNLKEILLLYARTEQNIVDNKLTIQKIENIKNVKTDESSYWNNYKNGFWDNFITEFLSSAATSGSYRIAGLMNIMNAIARGPAGNNSFVIVDPSTAAASSKFLSGAGKAIAGVGVALDLSTMLLDGENIGDAVVKAGAHLGIGMAVGAILGSVIPGPGTAAGAVAGLVIGAVVTYGANTLFDYIYDDPKGFLKDVEGVWNNFVKISKNTTDKIGCAVSSEIGNIGMAF